MSTQTKTAAKGKTNQSAKMRYLTLTGLMAAMITMMTAYICHIPIGVNGGYIHFGDSLIYLAAVILPTPYALAAAVIGGGLADLMTAPMWAPATIIIKMLITIPFTNKSTKIITPRNIIATVIAYLITGIGYFIAEYIIFGAIGSALIASLSGNLIQSVGSAVFFIIFGLALDKVHLKSRLNNQ
ncbi:MAG: TIGR04002 family protein [Lachnospiraceae bacterium]|nr:TIGR04002 family protein [Lachnospiraceae bacterium]